MKIAFVFDAFPIISETFILNQITGLIDLGHSVEIFAGSRLRPEKIHPQIKEYHLLEHASYHNEIPENKFLRIVKAVWLLLLYGQRNPRAVFNSLNFFKYGRDALALGYFYKVMFFLAKGKFDIIQCHFGPNGNLAALLKEMGISGKIVTMFHSYGIQRGIRQGGEMYRKLFQHGDCFLSISDFNYNNLLMFGAPPEKIISHPVGINLQWFPFRASPNFSHPNESIRILSVARLAEPKGLHYGIEAVKELVHNHPSWQLKYEIVGSGPLKEELERLVEQLNLRQVVDFFGPAEQKEVLQAMQQAHIFLLSSIAEALPVTLMEAQAVGLPIVATSVGAISSMVADGHTCFLVAPKDAQAIAQRLEYLIEHPEIWSKMGRAGRRFIEERYDINRLNRKLEEIYQGLLNGDKK